MPQMSVPTIDDPRRSGDAFRDPSDAGAATLRVWDPGTDGFSRRRWTREFPIPAWAFGLLAFGMLPVLLLLTWSIGKGRPHS